MINNQYFLDQMKTILKDEYPSFLESLNVDMKKSVRLNPLKTKGLDLVSGLEKSQYDDNSYILENDDINGKHPYHYAGLFYLQEPSAAMVVKALDIKENDWVLDMCAAPGGKSTQILSALNNTGKLVTNEINNNRCMTLLSNLERWGASNYILTNYDSKKVADTFTGMFDKVLIDAPCSGASMFKKYPESVNEYTQGNVLACAKRQLEILENGKRCLKEKGVLVYSTCTYNTIENEQVVYQFLKNNPDFQLVDCNLTKRKGVEYLDLDYSKLSRVFPMDQGEGHFVCKVIKHSSSERNNIHQLTTSKNKLVDEFINQYFDETFNYYIVNDKVYYCDEYLDIKTVRQGVLIGQIVKQRFEPEHHLFVSLLGYRFKNICNITDVNIINKYLKGESLMIPNYSGYVQIRYNGVPIGFGKADKTIIKNKFPKGLRIL